MPELPEVETVRRSLTPKLVGRTITGVEVLFPGAVEGLEPGRFRSSLVGERFAAVERYGKYLVFRLASGRFFLMHLRMTGEQWCSTADNLRILTAVSVSFSMTDASCGSAIYESSAAYGWSRTGANWRGSFS